MLSLSWKIYYKKTFSEFPGRGFGENVFGNSLPWLMMSWIMMLFNCPYLKFPEKTCPFRWKLKLHESAKRETVSRKRDYVPHIRPWTISTFSWHCSSAHLSTSRYNLLLHWKFRGVMQTIRNEQNVTVSIQMNYQYIAFDPKRRITEFTVHFTGCLRLNVHIFNNFWFESIEYAFDISIHSGQ